MYDLIVLGGGPAGVTAALRARELGAKVALVERGQMGGTCTNDGCAPTRALAKTARLLRDTKKFSEYGLDGEAPVLNWERVLARTHYVVNALHEKKQLIGHLQASGVDTFLGAGDAQFVDAHTVAIAASPLTASPSPSGRGEELQAEKFIIAAGGHGRRLQIPGIELTLTHSDIWTMKKLPQRVGIVGAAATGCQLASVLRQFGAEVVLLDLAPRILPLEDELTSKTMQGEFESSGIRVETGIGGVAHIERAQNGLHVTYLRDGQEIGLDMDALIMSVGWIGNVEGLNLDAAGIQTQRGYIAVNDSLQTSAPNIFAAGDITGRMMLVQSAMSEGFMAAENALSTAPRGYTHQLVPHGGFTDPEYGSVGLTEVQAQAQGDYIAASISYAELDRAVIDDATVGFCKLIASRTTHQILGAHVVGEQALEVTQMVAAAMASNAHVGDLARMEIAYPTYSAIVGLAARRIVRDLNLMETSSTWSGLGRLTEAEWERTETDV